jgi:hypothetical protein
MLVKARTHASKQTCNSSTPHILAQANTCDATLLCSHKLTRARVRAHTYTYTHTHTHTHTYTPYTQHEEKGGNQGLWRICTQQFKYKNTNSANHDPSGLVLFSLL